MPGLNDILRRTETITFDCYGTLISWAAGLESSLSTVFGEQLQPHLPRLFSEYVRIEAEVEVEPYRPYRDVLAEVVRRLGTVFSVSLPAERAGRLAADLPCWPPFADTVDALQRLNNRYRLGVLSNIDRDLFQGTAQVLGDPFDFVVTAEDVRSYKPGRAHFDRLIAEYASKDRVLHVAQSLFHDGIPAQELGIAFVWINRYKEENRTSVRPVAEFGDLAAFADVACSRE